MSLITNFLAGQQMWLRLVGGAVLISLGGKALRPPRQIQAAKEVNTGAGGIFSVYTSIFFLTLSNPTTIIFLAGIYASQGEPGRHSGSAHAVSFALGIFFQLAAAGGFEPYNRPGHRRIHYLVVGQHHNQSPVNKTPNYLAN